MTNLGPQPAADGRSMVRELIGIELRSFLVLHMRQACGNVTVGELVRAMDGGGFTVAGRPSKVISDALRWEVARGRVNRVGRGIYRLAGRIPRSTLRRMKKRVIAAVQRRPAPPRSQPLREQRPLVSADGPWRYRLRYGLAPPRRPRQRTMCFSADQDDHRTGHRSDAGHPSTMTRGAARLLRGHGLRPK